LSAYLSTFLSFVQPKSVPPVRIAQHQASINRAPIKRLSTKHIASKERATIVHATPIILSLTRRVIASPPAAATPPTQLSTAQRAGDAAFAKKRAAQARASLSPIIDATTVQYAADAANAATAIQMI
jgi:hypothetical protein